MADGDSAMVDGDKSTRAPKPGRARSRERGRGDQNRSRAVAPVVGKAMEASIVVLYVGLLSASLYGGVVPEYRTAAGEEVGERVLAESAQRVQQAVPPDGRAVEARTRVSLPETLRGRAYSIRVENRSLVLDHPREEVGGTVRLALPETVTSVDGNWSSRESAVVVVRTASGGGADGLVVRLEPGDGGGET